MAKKKETWMQMMERRRRKTAAELDRISYELLKLGVSPSASMKRGAARHAKRLGRQARDAGAQGGGWEDQSMSAGRCDHCGGRLDRPSLFCCKDTRHPAPDLAERIVRTIERDLRDRRGLRHEFEACDDDMQDEIRDAWVQIVRDHLAGR